MALYLFTVSKELTIPFRGRYNLNNIIICSSEKLSLQSVGTQSMDKPTEPLVMVWTCSYGQQKENQLDEIKTEQSDLNAKLNYASVSEQAKSNYDELPTLKSEQGWQKSGQYEY
jgi:hypothetical protein